MKSLRSFTSVEESGTTQDVDFVWVWGGGDGLEELMLICGMIKFGGGGVVRDEIRVRWTPQSPV